MALDVSSHKKTFRLSGGGSVQKLNTSRVPDLCQKMLYYAVFSRLKSYDKKGSKGLIKDRKHREIRRAGGGS